MGLIPRLRPALFSTRHIARHFSSFKSEDLQVFPAKTLTAKPPCDSLVFGHQMTDYMLEIDFTEKDGWHKPVIRPLEPLKIHPAAKVLHYATELFEGMKAYRCVDNKVRLFRPMENINRMSTSAERAALPKFDKTELLKCIKKLVSVEQEWVPYSDVSSLYLRPTFIGTEPTLGVSATKESKLFVICCPVGPYFPTGLKPVSLLADPQFVRSWPGGCGAYKMGSNYAPTIKIQEEALKHDCQQILWLFGDDHEMTEVGTMNLFIYWINEQGEKELITPPLESGLILPGITRKSLIEIAKEWNEFKVSEKPVNMATFAKAVHEGRVKEVFGSGTACVVCPVNKIVYQDQELVILKDGDEDYLTQRFYKDVNNIHYGKTPHHWMESIDEDDSLEIKAGVQQ